MIYLSAGHYNSDPGAVANGYKEADLTKELRDLIAHDLTTIGAKFILDKDEESLGQYLKRIKPGSGSVVCELHFNAATVSATGVEVLVKNDATTADRKLANELINATVSQCGLFNRGVKPEALSHRGRLAILHSKAGISVLPEICFITNKDDMQRYERHKKILAFRYAKILKAYDDMYS